jgi:hypothetical protein
MSRSCWIAVCALSTLAASFPTGAASLARSDVQGASGLCKAATPAYAAGVRYRPLGVSNEASENAFVTCNWQGDDNSTATRGATRVYVVFSNFGGAPASVSCTLVEGHQDGAATFASYTPKTISIPSGAGATLQWLPSDVQGGPSTIELPSLSCTLPAGTTMNYTGKEYSEDVGA